MIEQLKQRVHLDVKTHVDDKNIESLQNAAIASDMYSLTHKVGFKSPNSSGHNFDGSLKNQRSENTVP